MQAVFWELPAFARWREHYLDDDDYRRLQLDMLHDLLKYELKSREENDE